MSSKERRLQDVSVLIVEDEMLLAMDYEAMLEREGCTVVGPAPREKTAMALLESARPDAAILDLNLGGQRPVALAEALAGAGVPFVIISGYSEATFAEPIFRDAPRLDKPLDGESLISTIERMLRAG